MPFDDTVSCNINEPMKIPMPRFYGSMEMSSALTPTSYDMGERMKLVAASSAAAYMYPQTPMVGPWCSMKWYGAFNNDGNSLYEQSGKSVPPRPPPGLEHEGNCFHKKSSKESEDGYDSSQSTCEASECAASSFCSWDEASTKSSLEHSDSIAGDSAVAMGSAELSLNSLSWSERSNLVLPFIARWAQFLGLTQTSKSIDELQSLILEHPSAQTCTKKKHGTTEHLRRSLEKLHAQELIQLMTSPDAPLSVQISIDTLAFQMQEELTNLKRPKQGTKKMKRRR